MSTLTVTCATCRGPIDFLGPEGLIPACAGCHLGGDFCECCPNCHQRVKQDGEHWVPLGGGWSCERAA